MWDVDALRAAMTPEQMDEWIAYSMVEPFGDQWRQTATITAEIATAAGAATTADQLMPKAARQISKPRRKTDDEARALMAAKFGS